MRIGVLYTAFNDKNFLEKNLIPWIEIRKNKLNNHEFIISVVSVPFEEYKEIIDDKDDGTIDLLKIYLKEGKIDYLIDSPKFVKEHIARNSALQKLLEQNIDYLWIVDNDEEYNQKNIESIINYVIFNKFVKWFSISFKNYVFDNNTYLIEPFTPPRIFANDKNQKILCFYFDNDILYNNNDHKISYKNFISLNIPKQIAWVKHFSWISNEKSKNKVKYQEKHFAPTGCSFKWNEQKGLVWNEDYFKAIGQSIPLINQDNSTQEKK